MSSSERSHAHLADSNQGEPGENDDSGAIENGTQHEIEPLRAPHCPLPPCFPCPWIPHTCCLLKMVTFIWLIQAKESLERHPQLLFVKSKVCMHLKYVIFAFLIAYRVVAELQSGATRLSSQTKKVRAMQQCLCKELMAPDSMVQIWQPLRSFLLSIIE